MTEEKIINEYNYMDGIIEGLVSGVKEVKKGSLTFYNVMILPKAIALKKDEKTPSELYIFKDKPNGIMLHTTQCQKYIAALLQTRSYIKCHIKPMKSIFTIPDDKFFHCACDGFVTYTTTSEPWNLALSSFISDLISEEGIKDLNRLSHKDLIETYKSNMECIMKCIYDHKLPQFYNFDY